MADERKLIKITDDISYLCAIENPLSADVVFIDCGEEEWIFDVGADDFSVEVINGISKKKNVVLSHFHQDHITNIGKIRLNRLFVSSQTKKYIHTGIENTSDLITVGEEGYESDNGKIKVVDIPSSHAKGCLALVYGDYAFLGDATYLTEKGGYKVYNVQKLKAMIETLEKLNVKYCCLSHERRFVRTRESVISLYKRVYSLRKQNESYIFINAFLAENL